MVLAAGASSRFGELKQLTPVGPAGEPLMDYSVYDARRAGFERVVFVIRPELEEAFRPHCSRLQPVMPADYVLQTLADLPDRRKPPPHRTKPWGTGHAVLAAAKHVDGPFAVINADDFYGAAAYRFMHEHLTTTPDTDTPSCALVGYRLKDTLSSAGGVSRAICRSSPTNALKRLTEIVDILSHDGQITGRSRDGAACRLTGDETVSMNCWGFTPAIVPFLQNRFSDFLGANPQDGRAEFLIPDAVNDLVHTGAASCTVLPTGEPWFGLTHPSDLKTVRRNIRDRIDRDQYPSQLSTG